MKNNRFKILNHDLLVGQYVIVPSVRSSIIDFEKGIGWIAYDVIVKVDKVNDLTFCFDFNGETHFELKNDVKKTKQMPNIFNETDKIEYGVDDFNYRISVEYGIQL